MTRRKKWIIIGIVLAILLTGLAVPILFIYYVNEKVVCHGDATPYCARGGDYLLQGQYDLALKDFDQAIQLIPGNPAPYTLRGLTYQIMGNYDHAEQDFKTALQISFKYGPLAIYQSTPLIMLEETYFLKGDFASSALIDEKLIKLYKKNNEQLIKLVPEDDAYAVIGRHIDLMRAGQDDHTEFTEDSKTATSNAWTKSVLEFFAGHMSQDDLIQKAANSDSKIQKQQICQANFYIAESLLSSDKNEAISYFKANKQTCQPNYYFQLAAHAELTRIGSQ